MTGEQAGDLLAMLMANYAREPVTEERMGLFTRMLQDMDYDEGKEAVMHAIATSQWWPTVAELRRLVAERRLGLPGPAAAWELAAAWAAWRRREVDCSACGGTGSTDGGGTCGHCKGSTYEPQHNPVVLPDAVLRAAQLVGGREGIMGAGEGQLPYVRSQFTKAYEQFREDAVQQVQVPAQLQLAAQARRAAIFGGKVAALPAAVKDL